MMIDSPPPAAKPTGPEDFEPAFNLYLDLLEQNPGLARGTSRAAFSRIMEILREPLEEVDAVRVTTRGHYLGHKQRFAPALFALLTQRSPQLEFPQWVRRKHNPNKCADQKVDPVLDTTAQEAAVAVRTNG
jgi:hypothetical protein